VIPREIASRFSPRLRERARRIGRLTVAMLRARIHDRSSLRQRADA
jgi:hypothetical protein